MKMKKQFLTIAMFIATAFVATAQATQTVTIVNSSTAIQFWQIATNQPNVIGRAVSFELEYFSTSNSGNTNKQLDFEIQMSSATAAHPTIVSQPVIIDSNDFSSKHKSMKVTLLININAQNEFVPNQTFYIGC
jgi:hypothetical protein